MLQGHNPFKPVAPLLMLAVSAGLPKISAAQVSAEIWDVTYEVTFDRTTSLSQSLRVSMSFLTEAESPVLLSLPRWTPGSYDVVEFAKNVYNFSAESNGEPLPWDKLDFDTWRINPRLPSEVTVSFDYLADELDNGAAWTQPNFAFFNGTNVFLFPEGGDLDFGALVRIVTEPDWLVATGMHALEQPWEYSEESFHDLVDMPFFVGEFDLDSTEIDDRWYRLATYPRDVLVRQGRQSLWSAIRRMVPPQVAVFRETPWDHYTTLLVFNQQFPGGAALEHQNSHLGIYNNLFIGNLVLASITAHEIFHAWNVKRLRPSDLVPYDYTAPQPTELLWISEGITDYYADLILVRSSLIPDEVFYQITAGKINAVADLPPVALEDASLSTWISPRDGTASIYYDKGSLLGFILDILIREESGNRASLDQVMRELYRRTYLEGRGFENEDFWNVIADLTGTRNVERTVYDSYVDGRKPLPWSEVLPLAAMELLADTARFPQLGVTTVRGEDGVEITAILPLSTAERAGVRVGDLLVQVGEIEVSDTGWAVEFRRDYGSAAPGTEIGIGVRRNGEELLLSSELDFAENVTFRLREDRDADRRAKIILRSILEGRVEDRQ